MSVVEIAKTHGFDLKPLIQSYSTEVYSCYYDKKKCGFDYQSKTSLLEHLKRFHKVENIDIKEHIHEYFMCKSCFKIQDVLYKLATHICDSHLSTIQNSIDLIKKYNPDYTGYFDNSDFNDKHKKEFNYFKNIFICSFCLWSFQSNYHLRIHRNTHKNLHMTDEMNSVNNQNSIKANEVLKSKKQLKCEICLISFLRPSHYKNHQRLHESKLKFECEYCSESFIKYSVLLSHVKSCHRNEKKAFKCEFEGCNREFLNKINLSNHISRSHSHKIFISSQNAKKSSTKERQNIVVQYKKCEHCDKQFKSSSKLKRHMSIHQKNKKYRCQYKDCKSEFNRKEHLNSHKNFHQEIKSFKCDECGSNFKYKENLLTHQKKSGHEKNKSNKAKMSFSLDDSSIHNSLLADVMKTKSNLLADSESIIVVNDDVDCVTVAEQVQHRVAEHVIHLNINSDDEQYTTVYGSVILENISGSARTDYKSNHFYIEKYRQKCNLKKLNQDSNM